MGRLLIRICLSLSDKGLKLKLSFRGKHYQYLRGTRDYKIGRRVGTPNMKNNGEEITQYMYGIQKPRS